MGEEYVLAIDCGTQSARALLFGSDGYLKAKEKVEFEPYFSFYPGWAEQDPEVYWESICTACQKLKSNNSDIWKQIIGVSVTTQRDTSVNVDEKGNILRPAILWLDQRMAECKEHLPMWENVIFSSVGMRKCIQIVRRKSKSNWIKENQPDIWEKTYKYLMLSGFLIYKLTGRMVDSIASQVGHVPFDYKNKCWPRLKADYKWDVFGVEKEKLPDLVKPTEIIGEITKYASEATGIKQGLPVIASGSDKGCETLGTGSLTPEYASISLGTTATVQTTSKKYFEPIQFMPAYPAVVPQFYNPEVEIFRGYWMISWFKKEFAIRELIEAKKENIPPEVLLDKRLNDIPPGSNGLILQPYWGPGLTMPEAKGSVIGFGDVHTRAHIYRAIIEGINYALLEGMERIEKKSGMKIKYIMVSGGGSQSDAICQIMADMFNRPVYKSITHETSGLGASISTFVSLGVYKKFKDAVDNMVHIKKIFKPNSKNAEIYNNLYNRVYIKIYSKLKNLYKQIQRITNYPNINL